MSNTLSTDRFPKLFSFSQNDTEWMCCNTPCESLAVSTASLPDLCYWAGHAHVDQCGPQGRSLLGGGHRFCSPFNDKGLRSVLGIRDILLRIRIHGSVPLTHGSGSNSGSDSFLH